MLKILRYAGCDWKGANGIVVGDLPACDSTGGRRQSVGAWDATFRNPLELSSGSMPLLVPTDWGTPASLPVSNTT